MKLINKYQLVLIIVLVLALFLRLFFLSFPDWQIFDEIYYYNFAKDYIYGLNFFDVHPPLGKLFISVGLILFKYSIFGARFFQAIAGVTIIYLVYLLVRLLLKNTFIAIVAMLFVFFETSLFVESRYALLNIFIVLFNLLSIYYFFKFKEKLRFLDLCFSFVFISLATTVKWTGIFTLAIYAIYILFDKNLKTVIFAWFSKKYFMRWLILIFCITLPYIGFLFFDYYKDIKLFTWHINSYEFHKNLVSHHPYASRWYTWFIDLRPIWLEFKSLADGNLVGVIEVGNPVIIIFGTLSIFYNLYLIIFKNDRNKMMIFFLLAILLNTLPWVFIKREAFYYHFIIILPYIILNMSYSLYYIVNKYNQRLLVYVLLFLAGLFFIWYWPLLNGSPIPYESYNLRIIIPSWR